MICDTLDATWGFPGGAGGKEPACQCRRLRLDPLKEGMAIHSSTEVTERAHARDLEGNYPLWVCCVEITFFVF